MKKTDPYSLRHQIQRATKDADQAEFSALKNGSSVVDSGVYDERIAGAMDDFDAHDKSVELSWHGEDLKYDGAVGHVHEEIERRISIMGNAYPFNYDGSRLKRSRESPKLYEFFLAICNSTTITTGEYVRLPRIFERISARLVAEFFGPHSKSIHTGAPRDEGVGKSFVAAMKYVGEKTNEWIWGPDEGLPDEPINGDAGCDFIVWPDTLDGRQIAQLFVLGQCACGNDWNTKLKDLSLKNLQKWFNPLSVVDPVRTFTTPFHITNMTLRESSRDSGLLFDRARLVKIGEYGIQDDLMSEFGEEIGRLIKLVLE